MVRTWWDNLLAHGDDEAKAMTPQLGRSTAKSKSSCRASSESDVRSVIATYEARIAKLEEERIVLHERLAKSARPGSNFDDTPRTALEFLSIYWILWGSGRLDARSSVLKLTFWRAASLCTK